MQQHTSFIILDVDYALVGAQNIKTRHFDISDPHNLINYTETQREGESLQTDVEALINPQTQPDKAHPKTTTYTYPLASTLQSLVSKGRCWKHKKKATLQIFPHQQNACSTSGALLTPNIRSNVTFFNLISGLNRWVPTDQSSTFVGGNVRWRGIKKLVMLLLDVLFKPHPFADVVGKKNVGFGSLSDLIWIGWFWLLAHVLRAQINPS